MLYVAHHWISFTISSLRVSFSSPELRGFFLIYVSCSSGNGQKLLFFDWLIQTVRAITLKFLASTHNVLFPVELIRAFINILT